MVVLRVELDRYSPHTITHRAASGEAPGRLSSARRNDDADTVIVIGPNPRI
jgi:hypothetical protein